MASFNEIEKILYSASFGMEQNSEFRFIYGQKRQILAVIIFQLYSHISRGSSRALRAASNVIVSMVYQLGIATNFFSSSSVDQIWIIGPYLHILAIIVFQVFGSVHMSLSECTLSFHKVFSISG
jgi:hypothetical protein